LNFWGKEIIPVMVGIGTVKKLTLENMGIAFGILSLSGTEPEIHLGVIYPHPSNCNVRFFENPVAILKLNLHENRVCVVSSFDRR